MWPFHGRDGHDGRKRSQVVLRQSADVAPIVSIGEQLADGLVHAIDHDDLRPREAPLCEFVMCPVLQATEEPVLAAPRPCDADLVVAAHRPVHRFPLAAAAEGGRWRSTDGLQYGEDGRLHLVRAAVEELVGR